MYKVAVYGSLLSGCGNHRLLESSNAKLIGTTSTKHEYTMLNLGAFPGVIEGGNTSIKLEIYEVDDECLKRLDGLEGYSADRDESKNFYNRKSIKTTLGETFIYIYSTDIDISKIDTEKIDASIVKNGDWLSYKKKHTVI